MQQNLTNLQMELLKMYSFPVSENILYEIKELLADYFAKKSILLADQEWENRNYNNETMDNWIFREVQ